MHLHLTDCLHDFGPLHGFWLYSFERYNGLLGNQPTNNRSIELQLKKRFLRDNMHFDMLKSAECMPLVEHFRESVCGRAGMFHSCKESGVVESVGLFKLPSKYTLTVLDNHDLIQICSAYAYLYPEKATFFNELQGTDIHIPSTCKKYSYIEFKGKRLTSTSEAGKVPYALATPVHSESSYEPRPIRILYFVHHNWVITMPGTEGTCQYSGIFAVCQWPQQHPDGYIMGKPVEVWCRSLSESGINSFVPIKNILSQAIIADEYVDEEHILVVIPLVH